MLTLNQLVGRGCQLTSTTLGAHVRRPRTRKQLCNCIFIYLFFLHIYIEVAFCSIGIAIFMMDGIEALFAKISNIYLKMDFFFIYSPILMPDGIRVVFAIFSYNYPKMEFCCICSVWEHFMQLFAYIS